MNRQANFKHVFDVQKAGLVAFALGFIFISLKPNLAIADVFFLELNKAIIQSEKVQAARQSYLSAKEDVIIANQPSEWTATLSGGHKYAETSTNGADYAESNNANLEVTVKRKLFDGGLSSAQENVAMLQLDIANAQINMAEEDVLVAAIEAYTGLVTARDQFRISTTNVERLNEHLRAAEIQLEVGESTPTELAGTAARLARAEASLIQSETALANALATYESLIGTAPSGLLLPEISADLPSSAAQAGDIAIKNKSSHHISILTERITRKNMDVLVAQVKPNVDLSLKGSTTENTLDTRDNEEFSASVNFTMPLYPSSSVRAKSRSVVADHRQSLFNLRDNQRSTRLLAENAFRQFKASQIVIKAYEAEKDAAIAVRNGTQQEVQFGDKTLLDQLDAEQDVVLAELNLLIAKRDLINASYQLKSAIGLLTTSHLGLEGFGAIADEPAIVSPLKGPYPVLDYDE